MQPHRGRGRGAASDRDPNDRREPPAAAAWPPPQLPHDVVVLVLRYAAALCPRSVFGCRLVSRGWLEAATEPKVQAILWRRCIGEEPNSEDGQTESGVTPDDGGGGSNASVGSGGSGLDDGEQGDGEECGVRLDVAEALALVESDIVGGRDRGRLDNGLAVLLCTERCWWRAAETLVRRCGAVDRHRSPDDHDDTGENEVMDNAVDGGDESLCLALLRCPWTAASVISWPDHAPVSKYVYLRSRRAHRWHSVEALRAGRVELAASLVRPRDEGGGGQLPIPLLEALCFGDVPWTEEVRPALAAAERGVIARRDFAHAMYTRASDRHRPARESQKGLWDRYERRETAQGIDWSLDGNLILCLEMLNRLENLEARRELQAVLDRLKLLWNRPLGQHLDDVEGH